MAITPQAPATRNLTELPEILQLPLGTSTKVIGNPDVAVALTFRVVPTFWVAIGLKVIVCGEGARLTTTICPTAGAAA